MQLKTILNKVQKFKSFVYGQIRWIEDTKGPTIKNSRIGVSWRLARVWLQRRTTVVPPRENKRSARRDRGVSKVRWWSSPGYGCDTNRAVNRPAGSMVALVSVSVFGASASWRWPANSLLPCNVTWEKASFRKGPFQRRTDTATSSKKFTSRNRKPGNDTERIYFHRMWVAVQESH
uniref:Uncharacterized protein n=1 Tax=Candidatus Kentrum sp. TC TaxID=2126339 RepID=A0A450Z3J3_9GAMM|nr:MAG: hypothetical protein BECKTC1821E_GA0114239_11101 [Candidatus Kentron sp. TC]